MLTRLDMAPDGMADMATAIAPLPSPEPGSPIIRLLGCQPDNWEIVLILSGKIDSSQDKTWAKR